MFFKLRSKLTLKEIFPILTILIFLVYKLYSLEYHFGDGNAYFYMAQHILDGQVPYRDFLLADPPLLVYLLAGVKLIIGQSLLLFLAIPPLLEAASAFILYLNLKKRNLAYVFLTPLLYLFSFLILATSDYVTGLHFVLLLLNLGFYWQKKPILAGICWGLASLIKLYTVPGLMAWIVWVIFSKKLAKNNNQWHYLKNFLLSYSLTVAVVMLPFMLISPKQILDYLVFHQFNRTVGISKLRIFSFFLTKDLILILASLIGIILTKNLLIGSTVLLWLIFYLVFKDLYYVYLGVFAPWLTAGFLQLLTWLKNKWPQDQLGQKLGLSLLILTAMFYLAIWPSYHQTTRLEGRFTQAKQVADYIQQLEKNQSLYGSHEVAPLIALMANKKLYNNQIDTNAQLFASGALDKQQISKKTVEDGVYLLTKVANIPQNTNIDTGYQGYFDQELFEKYCQRLKIIEGAGYELFDDIAIYDCQGWTEL